MSTAAAPTTEPACLTLVDAARVIFPTKRGNSGYDCLRRMVQRRRCPVQFSYGRGRKGRLVRYLRAEDLPILQAWVKALVS